MKGAEIGDIMEYTVIARNNLIDFEKTVNKYIQLGWKIKGGISVSVETKIVEKAPKTEKWFYQALIKK